MIKDLENAFSEYCLLNRGVFNARNDELAEYNAQSLVLVGVAGSAFWPKFKKSAEYLDGQFDPLDRWSKRIGDAFANKYSARAVYPSDGPPYYPFIGWAKHCETVHSSKMGFSIHPEFGLWHAFRFALLFPKKIEVVTTTVESQNPCSSCIKSPCLSNCPVSAYTKNGFDPDKCFEYLQQNENGECRTKGCITRRSCPEGIAYQYVPEHAEFHMTAFYNSQKNRRGNK